MHKKLLLMMLVPILALSMVITSCGGDDDDGIFNGNPTYHRIQGVWFHDDGLEGAQGHTLHWFLATPSQVAVSDLVGATGVGSRTDFAFASMPGDTMFQGRYFNENAFRIAFISRLNELESITTDIPSTTLWPVILDQTTPGTALDQEFETVFRDMFPTNFFGVQLLNVSLWRGFVEDVVFYLQAGDIVTLIPFSLNFHAYYGGAHIGRIHGFWIELDDQDPMSQQLWVTERFVVRHAENQLIPQFGLYSRIMPEDGPLPPDPTALGGDLDITSVALADGEITIDVTGLTFQSAAATLGTHFDLYYQVGVGAETAVVGGVVPAGSVAAGVGQVITIIARPTAPATGADITTTVTVYRVGLATPTVIVGTPTITFTPPVGTNWYLQVGDDFEFGIAAISPTTDIDFTGAAGSTVLPLPPSPAIITAVDHFTYTVVSAHAVSGEIFITSDIQD